MTGAEGPAQPGLKATLKALGDGLLHPAGHPRGNAGTAALLLPPLAGLYSRSAVADFLSELSKWVTSPDPICSLSPESATDRKLIQQFCSTRCANAALL